MSGNGIPFHSRRIGLTPSGERLDILAGAKLTGRAGAWNVGLLDAVVDSSSASNVEQKNLAVGRVAYNLPGESTVGLVATHGDPRTNGENAVVGFDYNYRDSQFLPNRTLSGGVWGQRSFDSDPDERGGAYGARLSYPNDVVSWSLGAQEFGDDFHPALGFLSRGGIRSYSASWGYRHRPATGSVRSYRWRASGSAVTGLDDDLQTANVNWDYATVEFHSDDRVGLTGYYTNDVLLRDFTIRSGVTIPAGDYTWHRARLYFTSSPKRVVGYDAFLTVGDFFTGERVDLTLAGQLRPSAHFNMSVRYSFTEIDLPQGAFKTHVVRVPLQINFNPFATLAVLPQYDNVSDRLAANVRLRWTVRPGSDVYAVYDQGWRTGDGGFAPTDNAAVFKVGWTARF